MQGPRGAGVRRGAPPLRMGEIYKARDTRLDWCSGLTESLESVVKVPRRTMPTE